MTRTLLIAEHDNQMLHPATLPALQAATQFDQPVDILLAGYDCGGLAAELVQYAGTNKVLLAEHSDYARALPETLTPLILDLAGGYSVILTAATTSGKNLLPRIAALLKVSQISEVTEIVTHDTFIRPIYAGNAFATVQSLDPVKVLTVRATAFAAAIKGNGTGTIHRIEPLTGSQQSRFVSENNADTTGPSLVNARIVVAGGRGLETAEHFGLLEQIAAKLGAAVGASRAAVDAGLAGNDRQVGQTGRIVAPDLYIAAGISGAIQHVAGMKDSKCIVAINRDAEAPIFGIADYGLVADLEQALPELLELL